MRSNYTRQLDDLKEKLLQMGELIKRAIRGAMHALFDNDLLLAQEVIMGDAAVNESERNIETLCLNLLLTQQPVAGDMRAVSSALKMITDMERIGDFATDIAEIVLRGGKGGVEYHVLQIEKMGDAVICMLDGSLKAFTDRDVMLARRVCADDDEVDGYFDQTREVLVELIKTNDAFEEHALDLMMVSKYLERIGDHAVNLAEWVIFSVTGVHEKSNWWQM